MEEEFEEADILWPDSDYVHGKARSLQRLKSNGLIAKKRKESSAVEIKINGADHQISYSWTPGFSAFGDMNEFTVVNEEEDDGPKKIIPPHVLVERRWKKGMAAYSVCVGNGRTLKERDLRQVRDAVLRMTGFLES